VDRPDGTTMTLCWGAQLDLRPVTSSAARQVENDAGEITDSALAGYIAKYATKGTGATHGADRPIRDIAHVAHLDLTPHHRAMIETAWTLGELPEYEALNLHRWAHMLGFRGHFLPSPSATASPSALSATNAASGACAKTWTRSTPTRTAARSTWTRSP